VAHQRPQPTDPLTALTKTSATSEAHSRMHGRTVDLWENVKAHGATGDGTTDDASAIQAAIDAAELIGGTVYFPPGVYIVGTELVVDTYSTRLLGSGMGAPTQSTSTVIKAAAASGLRSVLRLSARFLTVDGLILNANSTAEVGLLCHDA
jgi:hypothetical protein